MCINLKFKNYQKYKELLYIFGFVFVIFLRWNSNNFDSKLMDMVGNEIFLFPSVLFICLFYFYHVYYHNIFIQTRLGPYKAKKNHFISILKECICFPSYIIVLSIILSIWDLSIDVLLPMIVFYLLIISFFILMGCIYFISSTHFKKFYYSVLCNMIPIFVYKYYIVWWKQYLSSSFDITRMINNMYLLFINIVGIVVILSIYKYSKYLKNIKITTITKALLLYGVIEYISLFLLRPYIINPNSFSFTSLLSVHSTDKIVMIFYWIMPKLYVIVYCFQNIYENYNHNLIFYMTRIVNREKWLRKLCFNMISFFTGALVIKVILHCLIYKSMDVEIIYSLLVYFTYLLFIWGSVVLIYLIFKELDILNFYLVVYLFGVTITAVYSIESWKYILLDINFTGLVIIFIVFLICYILSVVILNNSEYYN